MRQRHLRVQSDLSVLTQIQRWFEDFCCQQKPLSVWSEDRRYCLKLAIAEGFSNAVRHAHRGRPLDTPIDLALLLYDDRLEIRIWDYGEPFDPETLEEPKPGTLRQGGYGWFLLRRLSDRVVYERCRDNRNCLIIEQGLDEQITKWEDFFKDE
ncbi:MAG: anti-sigma regulatory factor [Cyanobacteria bacterium SID2]|nr:anti-sigma regulatory factor [Cyanobacteria bacterium SID2]MBP0004100.1 anti-sigma regulatory factor [Cyanobacteria bacterium SBC]